jgi:cytochrome b561
MTIRNTYLVFGSVAKFFHWVIFILVLTMLVFGFFLDAIPKDSKPFAYNVHKITGLVILLLMVLRGMWSLSNPKPRLPIATAWWQRATEWAVQLSLYAVIIAMPLVGWIGSVAASRPPYLGSWELMLPIAPNKELVHTMFELHEWFAYSLIALLCIHIGAALYHHFLRRDNILLRMLPECFYH